MKDLYRCLSDHPLPLRRAIAEAWQTGVTPGMELDDVRALADAILASPHVAEVLAALSAQAREALTTIVRTGGALPAHRLRGYGSLPRLGSARLARERPWLSPANPLEELYYAGLVYRAYGSPEEALGEIVLVPIELSALVAGLLPAGAGESLRWVDAVPQERLAGDAFGEDLLAVLVCLRLGEIGEIDPQPDPSAAGYDPAALDLGSRLQGPPDAERLALLRQILWRLRLVRLAGQAEQPSLRARDWMRLPQVRRQRTVYVAWRDDPHWNELYHLEGLQFGEAERSAHPIARARRNLVAVLEETAAGRWIALADLVAHLKRVRPDWVRTDGDYESAYARSAVSGEYLTGFGRWDEVEGALARHLLTRPLHWLGMVDLGLSSSGQPQACRLSAVGRRMLAEPAESAGLREPPLPATVATTDDALIVTMPVDGTLNERYRLERIAEWLSQDETARYRLTPASIWQRQEADVTAEQIARFLRRLTRGELDAAAQETLRLWGERYGRVAMRRVVLLETVDEATMQQLVASRRVRALLGPAVTANARLVEESNVDALSALLREMGIWALLRRGRHGSDAGAPR